ncbi:MAG: hypothetical protein VW270_27580, partial [Candidatus Poseidoniales archaeon]
MMDYYHALLDRYELLKKRKFKMSIMEQGEDPKAAAEAAIASAAGKTRKDAAPVKSADGRTGYVWTSTKTAKGGGNVTFTPNEEKKGIVFTIKGKEGDRGYDALVGFIAGDKEKKEPGTEEVEQDPNQQAMDGVVSVLQDLSKDEGSPFYVDPNLGRGSSGAAARNRSELVRAFYQGLADGRPVELSRSEQIQEVENRITSDNLDPKKKGEVLQGLNSGLVFYKKFVSMSPEERAKLSDDELAEFSRRFSVDEQGGVLVDGVYVSWST